MYLWARTMQDELAVVDQVEFSCEKMTQRLFKLSLYKFS